jgi:hypothetical protein
MAEHDDEDEYKPRAAEEIPKWELEEMILEMIRQGFREDIAERALKWPDERLATKH